MFGSNTKDSQEDPAAIRLLLVENHELILAGMRALLQSNAGLKVVGEARNATEVLDAMRLLPDVVLMELDLGPDNGLGYFRNPFETQPPSARPCRYGIAESRTARSGRLQGRNGDRPEAARSGIS